MGLYFYFLYPCVHLPAYRSKLIFVCSFCILRPCWTHSLVPEVNSFGFSKWIIMSSVNGNNFFFTSNLYAFYIPFLLHCLNQNFQHNVKLEWWEQTSCLVPDLRRKAFSLLILSIMLSLAFCWYSLSNWGSSPSISIFLRVFTMSGCFVKCFSSLIEITIWFFFFSLINMMDYTDFKYWINFYILGTNHTWSCYIILFISCLILFVFYIYVFKILFINI